MPVRDRNHGWIAAGLCVLSGAALCCAPPVVRERLRSVMRDVLRPGQVALQSVQDRTSSALENDRAAEWAAREAALRAELRAWKAEARMNAALAAGAGSRNQPAASTSISSEPLFSLSLLNARVLSRAEFEEAGQILAVIDAGDSSAASAMQWVIDGELIPLDQGADEFVAVESPVVSGRSIYGRIAMAGQWTSTVRHLTDREFRTHARLVRNSPGGPVLGAEGMLVGSGNGRCRLELIANTEPVDTGDEVWTAEAIPGLNETFLLGKVAGAELVPTEAHWSIDVEPDVPANGVDRVQVVRVGLNPARVANENRDTRPEGVVRASHEETRR